MKKNEIKAIIEGIATNLNNGEFDVSEELTKEFVYSRVEKTDDFNEEDYGGVIVEKDKNGTVYTFIDDFSVYPVKYTADEFAEVFATA